MKLQFIEEDNLLALKSNLSKLAPSFSNPDNTWITEYFGYTPFVDSKFNVEDFELDISQEKPFLTEFENVKRVYNRLKFISDSQASDERLWAGLCLGKFWSYTKYRWNVSTPESIQQHFMFGYGARRSYSRNALSRLWWIGRLTYDNTGKRSNPYELTEFVCENADNIMHVLERNTSNNPMIVHAFLSAIVDSRTAGVPINTNIVGELSKYLNLLGGTYILDCLPYQQIYDKIMTKSMLYKK
jgi:hypothetical protein